jgi:hypothetical protein
MTAIQEFRVEDDTTATAVAFLQWLRPGGLWVLTAIDPNSNKIETMTATTAVEAASFVANYNGSRNIYYAVNPTRTALSKKAKKTDVAAVEYLLADLDPNDEETPEEAKARYLEQLRADFEPKPTAVIDSGNGIQVLWKLESRVPLGEPTANAVGDLEFSAEDQDRIADVEKRAAAAMKRLGSKPGPRTSIASCGLPGRRTCLPPRSEESAGWRARQS